MFGYNEIFGGVDLTDINENVTINPPNVLNTDTILPITTGYVNITDIETDEIKAATTSVLIDKIQSSEITSVGTEVTINSIASDTIKPDIDTKVTINTIAADTIVPDIDTKVTINSIASDWITGDTGTDVGIQYLECRHINAPSSAGTSISDLRVDEIKPASAAAVNIQYLQSNEINPSFGAIVDINTIRTDNVIRINRPIGNEQTVLAIDYDGEAFDYKVVKDMFGYSGFDGFYYKGTSANNGFASYASDYCVITSWADLTGIASMILQIGGTLSSSTNSFLIESLLLDGGTYYQYIKSVYESLTYQDFEGVQFHKTSRWPVNVNKYCHDKFLWTNISSTGLASQELAITAEGGEFNFEANTSSTADFNIMNSYDGISGKMRIRLGAGDRSSYYNSWCFETDGDSAGDMASFRIYPYHRTAGSLRTECPFTMYYPASSYRQSEDCSLLLFGQASDLGANYNSKYSSQIHVLNRGIDQKGVISARGANDSYDVHLIGYNATRRDSTNSVCSTAAGGCISIQMLGDEDTDYQAGSFAILNQGQGSTEGTVMTKKLVLNSINNDLILIGNGSLIQASAATSATSMGKSVVMQSDTTGKLYPMSDLTTTASSPNAFVQNGAIYRSTSSERYKTINEEAESINPQWILDIECKHFQHENDRYPSYGPIAEEVYEINRLAASTMEHKNSTIQTKGWQKYVIKKGNEKSTLVEGLDTNQFIWGLIDVVKSQQEQINELQTVLKKVMKNQIKMNKYMTKK